MCRWYFDFWFEGKCELFYLIVLDLEGGIVLFVSFFFIVWYCGGFFSVFCKVRWISYFEFSVVVVIGMFGMWVTCRVYYLFYENLKVDYSVVRI